MATTKSIISLKYLIDIQNIESQVDERANKMEKKQTQK